MPISLRIATASARVQSRRVSTSVTPSPLRGEPRCEKGVRPARHGEAEGRGVRLLSSGPRATESSKDRRAGRVGGRGCGRTLRVEVVREQVRLQHVAHERGGIVAHAGGRHVEAAALGERHGEAQRDTLLLAVLVPVLQSRRSAFSAKGPGHKPRDGRGYGAAGRGRVEGRGEGSGAAQASN